MPRMPSLPRTLFALLLPLAGCGPKTVYTDSDVPKLPQLDDVMWSQAQAMDPQFKKIGRPSYTDEEFTAQAAAGTRLGLTTERLKTSFSKGSEWDQLASQLASQGADLVASANAKDPARASAALASIKATCKSCHSKFR